MLFFEIFLVAIVIPLFVCLESSKICNSSDCVYIVYSNKWLKLNKKSLWGWFVFPLPCFWPFRINNCNENYIKHSIVHVCVCANQFFQSFLSFKYASTLVLRFCLVYSFHLCFLFLLSCCSLDSFIVQDPNLNLFFSLNCDILIALITQLFPWIKWWYLNKFCIHFVSRRSYTAHFIQIDVPSHLYKNRHLYWHLFIIMDLFCNCLSIFNNSFFFTWSSCLNLVFVCIWKWSHQLKRNNPFHVQFSLNNAIYKMKWQQEEEWRARWFYSQLEDCGNWNCLVCQHFSALIPLIAYQRCNNRRIAHICVCAIVKADSFFALH